MKLKNNPDDLTWKLREISWQVNAIGFLVSQLSKDAMPDDEIFVGLGSLLEHLGTRISRVRNRLDDHLLKMERKASAVTSKATT